MQKLVDGIHRFQTLVFNSKRELFRRLAEGQNPEALFISCSDSRVNPNLITQTEPGDLFILRNAGNIVPPAGALHGGEAGTIEYAIEVLGVRHIIICGHSLCGAMEAILDPTSCANLPSVASWLNHAAATRRIMERSYSDLAGDARLVAAVEENVLVQVENLRTHASVAAALVSGKLTLHAWVYKMETGGVFAYDNDRSRQFVPLAEVEAKITEPSPVQRRRNGHGTGEAAMALVAGAAPASS